MRAAILSIGSELLHGFLTDTNATFLTQELAALGVEVMGVFQVGDDLQRIVTAFRRALEDADLAIATGGIGPTEDDLTREAVAEICGEEPRVDDALVENVRSFFTSRGIPMPVQNAKQAWLIPSAESLPNPMGTAPGWYVRHGGQAIAIMPGVPREMYRMWREQIMPRLAERLDGRVIASRTLKTVGIGESAVEEKLIDIVRRGSPVVATYAKNDGVHVRVTSVADNRVEAERIVAEADEEIRARIGQHVYGYLDDALADVILRPVEAANESMSIWEAGNAGRLAHVLLERRLADNLIVEARATSYDFALGRAGVADSPEAVAAWCAQRVADSRGVGYGVSVAVRITNDETPDRAAGEIGIALASRGATVSRGHQVTAIAPEIRRRATLWASEFLWSNLRDGTPHRRG